MAEPFDLPRLVALAGYVLKTCGVTQVRCIRDTYDKVPGLVFALSVDAQTWGLTAQAPRLHTVETPLVHYPRRLLVAYAAVAKALDGMGYSNSRWYKSEPLALALRALGYFDGDIDAMLASMQELEQADDHFAQVPLFPSDADEAMRNGRWPSTYAGNDAGKWVMEFFGGRYEWFNSKQHSQWRTLVQMPDANVAPLSPAVLECAAVGTLHGFNPIKPDEVAHAVADLGQVLAISSAYASLIGCDS